jgi:hypothetical protein
MVSEIRQNIKPTSGFASKALGMDTRRYCNFSLGIPDRIRIQQLAGCGNPLELSDFHSNWHLADPDTVFQQSIRDESDNHQVATPLNEENRPLLSRIQHVASLLDSTARNMPESSANHLCDAVLQALTEANAPIEKPQHRHD